jgi:hypothetical protein
VGLRRRHDASDAHRPPPDELVQQTARGRW